ncbi:MAG TPA: O-antigen ligase family protein [Solirubrobacterales bacterium]|nr:O-antigen ligase family protein [Solirubrobacterales bacterium]
MSPRHIAGLGVWLVVVGILVFGGATQAKLGRPLLLGAGLIGGLAVLSVISSLWSGSVELSVIEADRVLVYLGLFLAAFLIGQTDKRRQRFAEGLAISVAAVALLGLGSRLLPHVIEVSNSLGSGPRLRYPLGYWNANGAMCGIAVGLLLWASRRAGWAGLRWLSAALLPAVLLTLYFTYSRGGLLALIVASSTLLVLSRDRLWLLAALAIGALGALPAVLAVQTRQSLANNLATQTSVEQGVTVLLILLAGTALTLLLFAALRRLEGRAGPLAGRMLALSRNPVLLRRAALLAAIVAIGAAVAIGGRAWHQFSKSDVQFPSDPQQHFSQLSGAGRKDFWRVAIDAFSEEPLLGTGAGTYVFSWNQHRSIDMIVHSAHSLYLQAFAELGIVGGLLVLALVVSLLWIGLSSWRAAPHPTRERHAALLAAMLAFAVGAGIDWFWQIAALGAVFFLAAGVLVGARCSQLASPPPETPRGNSRKEGRRFGLAVAGLLVAWVSAIALIGPLLVDREIAASQRDTAQGNFAAAESHANTARSIEPWAASPYVQLGLLAELQGEYRTADQRLTEAIEREDRNWQLYFLRARVRREAGDTTGARADLARARQLDPLAPELKSVES